MTRSTVELDIQTIHVDDLGEIVGEFYGTPIRQWNASESRKRETADMLQRFERNRMAEEALNAVSL